MSADKKWCYFCIKLGRTPQATTGGRLMSRTNGAPSLNRPIAFSDGRAETTRLTPSPSTTTTTTMEEGAPPSDHGGVRIARAGPPPPSPRNNARSTVDVGEGDGRHPCGTLPQVFPPTQTRMRGRAKMQLRRCNWTATTCWTSTPRRGCWTGTVRTSSCTAPPSDAWTPSGDLERSSRINGGSTRHQAKSALRTRVPMATRATSGTGRTWYSCRPMDLPLGCFKWTMQKLVIGIRGVVTCAAFSSAQITATNGCLFVCALESFWWMCCTTNHTDRCVFQILPFYPHGLNLLPFGYE